jgi:hypothetical protein
LQRGCSASPVGRQAAIKRGWDDAHRGPKPSVWTAEPDSILEKIGHRHEASPSFCQVHPPGRMIVVARREDELPWLSAETWMRRNAVRRDCPTRGGGPCGDGGEGSSRAGQGRREPAPAGRTPGQGKEPTGTGTDDGAGAPPGAVHGRVQERSGEAAGGERPEPAAGRRRARGLRPPAARLVRRAAGTWLGRGPGPAEDGSRRAGAAQSHADNIKAL